jgi:hypothetical protein
MTTPEKMKALWLLTRDRLVAKGLLNGRKSSLSVRCPSGSTYWVGLATDTDPILADWCKKIPTSYAGIHDSIYNCREDVGAVAMGGGAFGTLVNDFGGALPQTFDEQARHIGPMAPAITQHKDLEQALEKGGNALIWKGLPLILGTTSSRMALNAELFEKCAKAYVAAVATGGRIKQLPWLVRHIANSRLYKDERKAADAFGYGRLPAESAGY